MRPPTKLLLVWLFAVSLVLPLRGQDGREETFANENCALTPPADWHRLDGMNPAGCFAAFANADRSRIVLLMVRERGRPAAELDDAGVKAFEEGVTKAGGGERLSGKFVELAGFHAYERRGILAAKGNRMSMLAVAMPTGDGLYLLEALATNGDAGEDSQIHQTLGTFRFLRPPGPPQSASQQLGYMIGYIGFKVFVAGLVIWLVVWAIVRNRAKITASSMAPYPYPPGSFPPPPPPSAPPPIPPPLPPAPR